MNKYIKRLSDEWIKYGKIIIAVDYDSTISPWPSIENTEDIERVIKLLQEANETGAFIVVFTACKPDRYLEIQTHCEEKRIPISGINITPIDVPFGNDKKIYANHFLDDRAGLNEACNILEEAMFIVRNKTVLKGGWLD